MKNLSILVPLKGKHEFSVFITDLMPDRQIVENGQAVPMYRRRNDIR